MEAIDQNIAGHPVKKVVLYGPESTGKTVLAQALAKHFDTLWAPEYARHYLDIKVEVYDPFGRKSSEICQPHDIPPIVIGQIAFEDVFAAQANRLLLCDTNPLTTYVYNQYYFGREDEWIAKAAVNRNYDLYLLTNIDVPWVPDPPHRDRPDSRGELYTLFKKALVERQLPYQDISGDYDARFQKAIAAIEALW
jgi:HTH-type transcriptional repressor of NAD biosynthesis genes